MVPPWLCHTRPYGSLHAAAAISDGVSLPSEPPRAGLTGLRHQIPVMLRQNCAPKISPIAGLYRATAREPKEKGDDQEGHDKGAVRAELPCSNRSRNVQ